MPQRISLHSELPQKLSGRGAVIPRGVADRLPGNEMNFSSSPRMAIDLADVEETGLIGFGSRVGYRWLFHRLYEAAILKALCAGKKLIIYITLVEYGVLGLLA